MVVAVSMVRDEADIIEATLRRMATQVDALVVADNMSSDGTRDILAALTNELPLAVIDDPEPGYWQARKMSALAAMAAEHFDADVVIPVDADEVWYSPFGRVADVLAEHAAAGVSVFRAALYDHVATALDPPEGDPVERIGWRRRDPAPLRKVACRPRAAVRIQQGNHGADYGDQLDGLLVVRHFPYRSPGQFVRKAANGAAAYAATDLPESAGAHWRGYGRILDERGPAALADVFRRWFWSPDPTVDATLLLDPCPL